MLTFSHFSHGFDFYNISFELGMIKKWDHKKLKSFDSIISVLSERVKSAGGRVLNAYGVPIILTNRGTETEL